MENEDKHDQRATETLKKLQDRINKIKEKVELRTEPRSIVEKLMWKNDMSYTDFKRAMEWGDAQTTNVVTGKQKSFQLESLKQMCKVLKTTPSEIYGFKE